MAPWHRLAPVLKSFPCRVSSTDTLKYECQPVPGASVSKPWSRDK